ncbi:hypothetical protein SRB5_21150 [Streptomyces sp. RB5]|uniref:HTH luxR-type domain-containing protein n=1 Tax=Streptomyces smaragdinus TaxID=2585196 RepID=A0A7K0CEU0_9ACTN|nr:LuxR family transcriptional regulator [Streptomyces smaragdinus]MQY11987.1 hypothetical protein [Streptomyces smaragdinus]
MAVGGPRLRGRRTECAALDRLVAAVRAGGSSVLVLRGEAGIGKTALLEYVRDSATGVRTAWAAGTEAESELAFGGLHQLCAPYLDRLDRLPEPQRGALATAFGLSAGPVPDRFLVGLAVLNLLADAAGEEPLVCLVDDAQWLDEVSAQTLAFVARRLDAEPVGLVLTVREPHPGPGPEHLPHLVIQPLDDSDSRALLDSVVPGLLDARVRERIVAEAGGNPLALLELPKGLTPMAGGFGRPDARPAGGVEESFVRRIRALPAGTRLLLLTAAAEPTGDPELLALAAGLLGVAADAAPAEDAGLITLGARVRFRHPLVRSAAYRAADPADRRRAHRALAGATDAGTDPDRRAWHLSHAATGQDEDVAAGLERSAGRAAARGGVAAAAALLERAAGLTPDPARRGLRALAAAGATYEAGAYDSALTLLDAAGLCPLDEGAAARSELLRGRIAFASRSAGAALPLLVAAGRRLEPLDAALARETYRDALYAALTAGRLPAGVQLTDVAEAVLAAPPGPRPERDDLLLAGLATVTTEGYAAGVPMMRRALAAYRDADLTGDEALGWLPFACRMAHNAWDFDTWSVLSERLTRLARETGSLSVLPSALLLRLSNRVYAGDLATAGKLVAEAATIAEVTGSRFIARYGALVLEPWRGREESTLRVVEALTRDAALADEGKVATAGQWACAVLYNGLGRYEEAYTAAEAGCANPQELGLALASTIELVEAAARSGRAERAADTARELTEMAGASGAPWALGAAACARAQVAEGPAADALYREAVGHLEVSGAGMTLVRTRLRYGEWLRRQGRRVDAREHLGAAYEEFGRMGAEAFAERARRELEATGRTVRKRTVETHTELTPQEAQIARLAGDGLTNAEIGAQLYLSTHTVEWHLRKVFAKLGITSRRRLGE